MLGALRLSAGHFLRLARPCPCRACLDAPGFSIRVGTYLCLQAEAEGSTKEKKQKKQKKAEA